MKELWVVEFNSANYCGASNHCLVWASSENEAMDIAGPYAYDFYYEQDGDQYKTENFDGNEDDDFDDSDVEYANVVGAEPLKGSEFEQYVADPSQSSFYPMIN